MPYVKKGDTTKRKKTQVNLACLHLTLGHNNTLINFTDLHGNTFLRGSPGMYYKNARKSTAYAAQTALENLSQIAKEHGVKTLKIEIDGIYPQRDTVLRAALNAFPVTSIKDTTKVPHGGCKKRKRPRK